MKILFWGAGNELKSFLMRADRMPDIFSKDEMVITDRDVCKHGKKFCGRTIRDPEEVINHTFDQIIVSSQKYYEDIVTDVKACFDKNVSVLRLKDYSNNGIISYQYRRHYENTSGDLDVHKKEDIPDKIIVYTAITGKYDCLREPEILEEGIRYICFTDDESLKSDVWEIRRINMEAFSAPIDAIKHIKIMPDKYFGKEDIEYSIWIDANYTIRRPIKDLLRLYMLDGKMILFPHMERCCLYDEAMECVEKGLADKETVLRQILRYYNEDFPIDMGLYCGGFIGRYHNDPEIIALMEDWLKEVNMGSSRDQISLPYVLNKHNTCFDLINENIYNNSFISSIRHNDCI